LVWLAIGPRGWPAPFNLAPDGDPFLGAGVDTSGSDDVPVVASGIVGVINDQDIAAPGPFNIRSARSVDTFAGGSTTNEFDFVGILFDAPVSGVNQIRVQNFAANDGGWWGPTTTTQNGVPLTADDLEAPEVQVTSDGGTTWTPVATTSTDYVTAFTGTVRGSGVPTSGATPLATFNFAPQNNINGIRLIGNGGGSVDAGPGFVGVMEMEVLQEQNVVFPTLDINTATGELTLRTGAGTARAIQGYSITSDASLGALNPAGWRSISDNYDDSGNGSIDADEDWSKLSAASSTTLLSESQFGGTPSDGGSLGANLALLLGNAGTWVANPFGEDIRMEILLSDGRTRRVDVTYNGMSTNPLDVGDFNGNGMVDAGDWPTVRDNFNADLAGLSLLQRYARGDLNNDGRNDRLDFATQANGFTILTNGVVDRGAMPATWASGRTHWLGTPATIYDSVFAWNKNYTAPTTPQGAEDGDGAVMDVPQIAPDPLDCNPELTQTAHVGDRCLVLRRCAARRLRHHAVAEGVGIAWLLRPACCSAEAIRQLRKRSLHPAR
jgi:hypothetical protein